MSASWIQQHEQGVLIMVYAQPGAKRNAIAGLHDNKLKVAIAAPPEKGKANQAICAFLTKTCGLSKQQVQLISGDTSRSKQFLLMNITQEQAQHLLLPQGVPAS